MRPWIIKPISASIILSFLPKQFGAAPGGNTYINKMRSMLSLLKLLTDVEIEIDRRKFAAQGLL